MAAGKVKVVVKSNCNMELGGVAFENDLFGRVHSVSPDESDSFQPNHRLKPAQSNTIPPKDLGCQIVAMYPSARLS